jgi:glucose-6-phosphate isomerase
MQSGSNHFGAIDTWQKLKKLSANSHIKNNLADSRIVESGLLFDYSRQHINRDVLANLLHVAHEMQLAEKITKLFNGEVVNTSENRPALHVLARAQLINPTSCKFDFQWQQMQAVVAKITAAENIKNIIHVGIGGSDLGPRLLADALQPLHKNKFNLHFVSSNDIQELNDVLKNCTPENTLVILVSKSFTTAETLTNGVVVTKWLAKILSAESVAQHLYAVTANHERAVQFGIAKNNILIMPEGIGGRFSIWSPVSIAVAVWLGWDNYVALVRGAHMLDQHFQTVAFDKNIPTILALLGIWNSNFLNIDTKAMLAYDARLGLLVPYMQQMYMESLGKSVNQFGDKINYKTGTILWGGRAPDSQHSFHQLLKQGSHKVALDFIVPIAAAGVGDAERKPVWANALAQAQVMWQGHTDIDLNKVISGGQASNMLLLPELNPYYLGALIALYEHKVFVQSVVWNINAFDQWGVEQAKVLSNKILQGDESSCDQVTRDLQSIIARVAVAV